MIDRLTLAIALCAAASAAQSDPNALDCERPEAEAIANAPPGVQRVSKTRLGIQWKRGTKYFDDVGVEEGTLDGTGYGYCGLVLGYHLIKKRDEGLFTGVLLEVASGKELPAGHTVMFAPDAKRYFAIQQPNGLYGEVWLIYSRSGALLWEGESGISVQSKEGNRRYFSATLEQPHWSVSGALEATLR